MTFDELVSEVYLITNRSDLVAETESAVKSATLKAHRIDFFSKDIHEMGVQFDTAGFTQSLDYPTLINNFRSFKYFRLSSSSTPADATGAFIEIITPEEVLDAYGVNRTNIAYVAGRVLEIRANCEFQFGLLGAYVNPIVTPKEVYSSWVADQFPYTIIHEAARRLFGDIGQQDKAINQSTNRDEEYLELRVSATTDVGS